MTCRAPTIVLNDHKCTVLIAHLTNLSTRLVKCHTTVPAPLLVQRRLISQSPVHTTQICCTPNYCFAPSYFRTLGWAPVLADPALHVPAVRCKINLHAVLQKQLYRACTRLPSVLCLSLCTHTMHARMCTHVNVFAKQCWQGALILAAAYSSSAQLGTHPNYETLNTAAAVAIATLLT